MTKRRGSALQQELRQNKPFRSASQEALLGLFRTVDLARRSLGAVLEPHGITLQQYNVLRILRGAGAAGLPTLEVAARMIEQAPGVTRLLDRMEAKRLVRRKRCLQDRRQVLCYVEPAGERLLDVLAKPVDDATSRVMSPLAEKDTRALILLMDAVRAKPR